MTEKREKRLVSDCCGKEATDVSEVGINRHILERYGKRTYLCPICQCGCSVHEVVESEEVGGEETLLEVLSNIEHERWARWQKYLHSLCHRVSDGSLIIPSDSVAHWEKLINTKYKDLPEISKESDRKEARITLSLLETTCREREKKCVEEFAEFLKETEESVNISPQLNIFNDMIDDELISFKESRGWE